MGNKFGLLAGLGLAIAAIAPLDTASAQKAGEPPVDPNQPKQKDQPPQKPAGKPGEPPRGPQNRPATPPPAKQAPVQQPQAVPQTQQPPQQRGAPPQQRATEPNRGAPPSDPRFTRQRESAPPVQEPKTVQPPPAAVQSPPPFPPNNIRRRDGAPPVAEPRTVPAVPNTAAPQQPVRRKNGPLEAAPAAPASNAPVGLPQRQFNQQSAPTAVLPAAPPVNRQFGPTGFQPGYSKPAATRLEDVQRGRTQRVEAGGRRTVIQENDNRVIVKQNNTTIIRHDETQRFTKNASSIRSSRRPDGTTQTIVMRPGGVQLFNIVDNNGRLVRRYRRDDRGREINIIDNRRFYRNAAFIGAAGIGIGAIYLGLRAPEIRIPRDRYIVDYDRASDDDVYEALSSPPIDRLERAYSLEEIRYNVELRDRMRRLDVDAVSFDSGSWEVASEQFPKLERLARIMLRIIDRNPGEVFLVEGHTDAVGPGVDNLTLSDRRAQAVAEILTGVFDVPPENLVTQGYGEQFLKVPTEGPERLNRRVAVRRISPLLGNDEYSDRR